MLRVEALTVEFGAHRVLDGVDLDVGVGETVVVLGPSGCGKSTLLRVIAGLEPAAAGRVRWDGADITHLAPHERRFGLMFQDYALFPHRDVAGNVEFGLRMAGWRETDRARRVAEVLALVGLEGYGRRRTATLSGGEQQRAALARALAPAPRLLMLDEPLGALDRVLRERLLEELRTLLDIAAVPALYVTHDHDEAFALAERIVVMREGRVVQAGTPAAVWAAPVDAWTARFLGFGPQVDARVEGGAVVTPWGSAAVSGGDGDVTAVLRPDAVRLDGDGAARGTVQRRTFAGDHVDLLVAVEGAPDVVVRAPVDAAAGTGDRVAISVDSGGVLVYRA
jgi:thiamine transport system ATP-binding protein